MLFRSTKSQVRIESRSQIVGMFVDPGLIQVAQKFLVRIALLLSHHAVIQRLENATLAVYFPVNQIHTRLVVVEGDIRPINAFRFILLLFDSENVLVEMILQHLVRIIDEQLLETVRVKILKPINIQHTDKTPSSSCWRRNRQV